MPIAIWLPSLETGNPIVDQQHKQLFEMVNELHRGIIAGKAQEAMGPVLGSLANYTINHFSIEEELMRTGNYPHYSRHKSMHDGLSKQVKDLLTQFNQGQLTLPSSLSKFLADWLKHHIMEEDKTMIAWLKEQKS